MQLHNLQRCTPKSLISLASPGTLAARLLKSGGLAAVDLPVDRRAAETQLASNRCAAKLGLQQRLDRHPVSRSHVRVVSSHLGDALQVARCRTSNLRPPYSTVGGLELIFLDPIHKLSFRNFHCHLKKRNRNLIKIRELFDGQSDAENNHSLRAPNTMFGYSVFPRLPL